MELNNVHISRFSISAPVTRFYANGNHQCHIRVEILKHGVNSQTGLLTRIPLTERERNSVSAALLSTSLNSNNLSMPDRWSITRQRNKFNLGLINQSASRQEPTWSRQQEISEEEFEAFRDKPCTPMTEEQDTLHDIADSPVVVEPVAQDNEVPEIIDLYISGSTTGSRTIMAIASVDVTVNNQIRTITITTNMNASPHIFNERVNIEGLPPFVIQPNMLSRSLQTIQDRREYVSKWNVQQQLITLFRWTLPFGLLIDHVVSTQGDMIFYRLGNTVHNGEFLTSGRLYPIGHSPHMNARDRVTGGCVWGHTYSVHAPGNQIVASVLHITGCTWTAGVRTGTVTLTFIDNFGNQQSFILSPEDAGRTLSINSTSI